MSVPAARPPFTVTATSAATVPGSELEGLASFYAEPYNGRKTANGETFDTYKGMTAAHRTLPFNTVVRVTNKNNGESVDVRINDRGPFVDGRVIDLSLFAAQKIDMVRAGVVPVKLDVVKDGDPPRAVAKVAPPAVPAAPGPPVSVPTVPAVPVYAVQVGAFETLQKAEELKKRLDRKYDAVTIQTYSTGSTVYRVRIGSDPDMQNAEKLASKLRKESLNPFVVRVN